MQIIRGKVLIAFLGASKVWVQLYPQFLWMSCLRKSFKCIHMICTHRLKEKVNICTHLLGFQTTPLIALFSPQKNIEGDHDQYQFECKWLVLVATIVHSGLNKNHLKTHCESMSNICLKFKKSFSKCFSLKYTDF